MKKTAKSLLLVATAFALVFCQRQAAEEKVDEVIAKEVLPIAITPAATEVKEQSTDSVFEDRAVSVKEIDTLTLSGYRLSFSPLKKTIFPHYFQDYKERESVTKGIDNSHEYARAVERLLLSKWDSLFSVTDSLLILKLDNGKMVSLPKWDEKNEIGHNLAHFFPDQNYYLVYVQFYEGSAWLLVNKKNGYKKYICGRPYFSPDGRSIITGNVDLDAGYSFNGIEFLKVSGDTLREEWRLYLGNSWGPANIKWTGNAAVAIEKTTFEEEVNQAPKKHLVSKLVFSKTSKP